MLENDNHKAGWIFNLDSEESLCRYIRDGVYSTKIKPPNNNSWSRAYLGTIADYASMRPGQLIYFFIKRKIYGIGELVAINGTKSCVFNNYKDSLLPKTPDLFKDKKSDFYERELFYYEEGIWDKKIEDDGERCFQQRWVCTFKALSEFYDGIDMDALLKTDKSYKDFRSLRTFWGLSFIKLSPSENKRFREFIEKSKPEKFIVKMDEELKTKTVKNSYKEDYKFSLDGLIEANRKNSDLLSNEMLIETSILHALANIQKNPDIKSIFSEWDYFSHQVTASPYKPVDYMDKMDICGYKGGNNGFWDANEYLLIEIKKDTATDIDLEQTQKYIEWLKWEYEDNISKKNAKIKAYLVAHNFDLSKKTPNYNIELIKYSAKEGNVNFVKFSQAAE